MELYMQQEELRDFYRKRSQKWRVWEDILNGTKLFPDSIIEDLIKALSKQVFNGLFLPHSMSSIEELHDACVQAGKKCYSFLSSTEVHWQETEVDDRDLLVGSLYYKEMLNKAFDLQTKYAGLMQLPQTDLSSNELKHLNKLRKSMFSSFKTIMDLSLYTLSFSDQLFLLEKQIMTGQDEMEDQSEKLRFWVEKCGSTRSETIEELWEKFYQINTEALALASKGKLSETKDSRFEYINHSYSYSQKDMDESAQLMGLIKEASSPRRLFHLYNNPFESEIQNTLNGKNLDIFLEMVARQNAIICGMHPELKKEFDKWCKKGKTSTNEVLETNTLEPLDHSRILTGDMQPKEEPLSMLFCPAIIQSTEATYLLREIVQGKIRSEVCGRAKRNSENWTWAHVRRAMVRSGFFGPCPEGKVQSIWEDQAISDTDFGHAIHSCDTSITATSVKTQCINHKNKHENYDDNIVQKIFEYLKTVAVFVKE